METDRRTPRPSRTVTGGLLVGFAGLVVAVFSAMGAPVTGYEPSIYRATPPAVWAGLGVAVLAAAVVAFRTRVGATRRRAALLLAGTAGWVVAALPLLRGYYFYGKGDALSHLGYARSFATDALEPTTLLHPGVHLTSLLVGGATGFATPRALVLTVFLFVLAFLVFVPLCVGELASARGAKVVGLFAALLLLPLNGVGTHIIAHPSSQAIMFLPVVLYLLFRYVNGPSAGWLSVTPIGGLLALTTGAYVLVHPQEALNLTVILGSVAAVQFVVRRRWSDSAIASHRTVYGQTGFLVAIWWLWAPQSPRVQTRLEAAYGVFAGGGSSAAPAAASAGRSAALSSLGGSLEELFVKLFLGSLVFSLVAGPVMVGSVLGWFDAVFPEENALNKYLSVAYVPLLAGTAFVFVGPFGDHYMRFAGFLMVIVTLVGAAALVQVVPATLGRLGGRSVRVATAGLLLVLLPVAVMGLHPSPWMYQDNAQVTEQEMTGYEATFEHNPGNVTISGVRSSGERYAHALYGPESTTARTVPGDPIPYRVFGNNLTSHYDDAQYIPVRPADVEREVNIYNGLRYGESGFRDLERTPGLNRVQSTDGFRVYMLPDQ